MNENKKARRTMIKDISPQGEMLSAEELRMVTGGVIATQHCTQVKTASGDYNSCGRGEFDSDIK